MSKRKITLLLLLIIIVLALAGGGIYYKYQAVKVVTPVDNNQPTAVPQETLATWVDPAEFEFQYPKSLNLNPHDEDKENYAHVELTSATSAGNLIVWVKDTSAADIETWVKQVKVKGAIDSALGGEPAKKVLTTDEGQKLTVTTIRDGYLYQIEMDAKDAIWNKIFDTVASSFKFTTSEASFGKEKAVGEDTAIQGSTEEELGFEEEIVE